MKIFLKIECETANELKSHLYTLLEQINSELYRLKLNPRIDELTESSEIFMNDNNCYGEHSVTIKSSIND